MKLNSDFEYNKCELDLNQFYEIGRANIRGNTKDGLSEEFVIDRQFSKIYKNVSELIKFCSQDENFEPGFIELSLFDPRDTNAKRFYTLLVAGKKTILKNYRVQMGCNIKKDITLLPNTVFYNTPFYYSKDEESGKYFEPLKVDVFSSKLLSFNSDADNDADGLFKEPKSSKAEEKIQNNVIDFFQRIKDPKLYGEAKNDTQALFDNDKAEGFYELNTFIIIPLYRPAAADVEEENIHRGGALMLFGHSNMKFNYHRFILTLQNLLLKQIFYISHSELSIQKAQTNLELDFEHHLKTTVSRLSDGLHPDSGFPSHDSLSDDQKTKLNNVKRGFDSLVKSCTSVLTAYKEFRFNDGTSVSTLGELLDAYSDFVIESDTLFNNEIEVDIENECKNINTVICFPPDIFKLILAQFALNAVNNKENSKANINVKISESIDLLTFQLSDDGPGFDEANIDILGIEPVNNADSAGMGLYLLNKSLMYLSAEKINQIKNEKRFFLAKNKISPNSGAIITFKFRKNKYEV